MAREGNKAVMPKLRFPAFLECDKWEYVPLGKLFSERQEAGFSDLPLLSLMDKEGIVPQDETNRKNNSSADKSKYLRVVPGDIVYNTMRMWEGRSAHVGIEGLVSPAYTVCEPAEDTCSLFFAFYFKTAPLIRLFRQFSQGLVKDTLNLKYQAFSRIEVAYPKDENEQQKIADCLTSLDELIAAQGRKVEALKTYKRGLMQKLFPREGETLPRHRFSEFRDAPEWAEQTLRSICNRIMDGTHFSPKTKEGPHPYLTSKNIRNGHIDLSTISYISEEEHREIYARCPVKVDDVLLTKDGANTGNCVINTLDYEFSLLSSVAVLRGDTARVKQSFLYQTIVAERTQSIIINSMSGQAIPRITLEKLGNYVVQLPGLAEQQRIADSLSSLDARITAESAKLAALKTHKQGLMQQLFPSQEEA